MKIRVAAPEATSPGNFVQRLVAIADTTAVRPFRVLIVDDDPAVRMLCAANLTRDGFEVIEAEDGQRGLERALAERPDLVLLDISMPVLDGFGLAAELRRDERTKELPVVFLSGETEPASRARAESLGALGFLSKPFDPVAVSALVARVLGRRAPAEADGPQLAPA
ncbi:MAG: response regulator [Actinobacteria bacterium]|nr:response regulator [Actinomycetota bacterium]